MKSRFCGWAEGSIHCAGLVLEESKALSVFPLLMPAMEGLLKHAQLMGVEYHEDALRVLVQVIKSPSLPVRMRLACMCAATTAYQYDHSPPNLLLPWGTCASPSKTMLHLLSLQICQRRQVI